MRLSLVSTGLALALLGGSAPGCSDAEIPDAYYDAGGDVDTGNLGYRDQPCLEGRCINDDLDVCVQQGSGDSATLICREICSPTLDDPCGLRRRCRSLDNGQGACLPANLLDESCPCDDGLACVNYSETIDADADADAGVDGGTLDAGMIFIRNTCKLTCTIQADGGDTCAPGEGECRLFIESDTDGVCID